ncbi:FirrV-1-B1 [Feldmannia irregularis virus a]|uniref:FirrV-1-B1 n=1 Tax=Feldmannia irregularis virus a TaxID=231992 RepID=Q6XM35_9PHYC|nr:FirrV-1-B1 [Feldmannia irregularis virus a]AAR26876.1 FirrV-1-B1 [Feldmannia irregularis virus a]
MSTLKERRAVGKLKPLVPLHVKKERDAMRKLKEKKKQAKKEMQEELYALCKTMLSTVPTISEMKKMTRKDFSAHRKVTNTQWTTLRKYLVRCNHTRFK